MGRTSEGGTLTIQVAPGDRVVRATIPSTSVGTETVSLVPGGFASVSIILDDSGEVTEPTPLIVAEAEDGIVPISSPTFTLDFMRDTAHVPLTKLEQVEMLDHEGNVEYEIGWMFTLSGGRITAIDPEQVFVWLPSTEPATLRVDAVDSEGFTHSNTVQFSVGQFTLHLTLAAPPSNPGLNVANVEVTVSVMRTPITLRRSSDANGQIDFPMLPYSTLQLEAVTQAGGRYYYGQTTLTQTAETWATLTMRNVDDVIAGVPSLQSQSSGGAAAASTSASPAQAKSNAALQDMLQRRAQTPTTLTPAFAPTTADAGSSATISVTSDGMDETVERNAVLTVPMGTEKVTLKYIVNSLEYPEWVRKQSPFDDVWALMVFGPGGQQLFRIRRNVNSQQYGDPSWQADGSTGELQEQIDVQTLAANGDIDLVLFGSAMNVRDALFDTTVNAELGAELKLTINKVEKDKVIPTRGDSPITAFRDQTRPTSTKGGLR